MPDPALRRLCNAAHVEATASLAPAWTCCELRATAADQHEAQQAEAEERGRSGLGNQHEAAELGTHQGRITSGQHLPDGEVLRTGCR